MTNLDEFNKELAELLRKHGSAIIAKSNNNEEDLSVEIGVQFGIHNKWYGRHHITPNDLS